MCLVSASGFFYTSTAILEDCLLSPDYRPSIIISAGAGFSNSHISYMETKHAKMRAMMGCVKTLMSAMKRIVGRLYQW
jgi:hypothetical protein